MKLVILTRPTYFVEEDKILASLFEEGMDNLHLLKPDTSPLFAERLLTLLPQDCFKNITVHDHFYLKSEYNLGGIHLDNPLTQIPSGYKGNVSATFSNPFELKGFKKKFKYVFLNNVFTPSDSNTDTLSFETLRMAASEGLIDKKVYAITSLSSDNIKTVKDLGFGGIVIRDDLWRHFDIHCQTDYKTIIEQFRKIKKAIG